MSRSRDDAPTPGSKWAILAQLNEVRGEVFALRTEVDVARTESRALSMAILSRIEVLMRADVSLIRKVNHTMSLVELYRSNLEVVKNTKVSAQRSYELLGAKVAAISAKLDVALSDDAATAAERAELAEIGATLTTEAASLMETVVANTPAEAEPAPAPTDSPVVVVDGEPTVEPPVEPAPAEPVAEQPAPTEQSAPQ